MTKEAVPEAGRLAMLDLFGCRRPDKRHHMEREGAQRYLDEARRRHAEGHDDRTSVYRCCAAGWVHGRERER